MNEHKNLGHKGNLLYPENSQEAILKTLTSPYNDGLELDVRMTKDYELIVIHDWNTFLTGNKMKLVKDMTLEALGSISCRPHRFDWWKYLVQTFSDLQHNYYIVEKLIHSRKKRSCMISLKEVLEYLPAEKHLMIEIKGSNQDYDENQTYQRVLQETIAPYQEKDIVVSSYNKEIITYLKQQLPKVKAGLVINERCWDQLDADVDFRSIDFSCFKKDPSRVDQVKDKELYLWTIDQCRDYQQMVELFYRQGIYPHTISNHDELIGSLDEIWKDNPKAFAYYIRNYNTRQLLTKGMRLRHGYLRSLSEEQMLALLAESCRFWTGTEEFGYQKKR